METETEEEYLLICDESSESFSSSVSLSDKSVDNVVEEYHSDAPFAGMNSSFMLQSNGRNNPLVIKVIAIIELNVWRLVSLIAGYF